MLTGLSVKIETGPQAGQEFHIRVPGSWTIGRASDCDFAVIGNPDPLSVSRHHCRIDATPNRAQIFDLGSRNGTSLNGEMIGQRFVQPITHRDWWTSEGYMLVDGDEIAFAGVKLSVAMEVEENVATNVDEGSPRGVLSC